MKKTLLYGLALLMAAGLTLSSCKKGSDEIVTPPVTEEKLAPTEPQMKTTVIEDFTGVRCPWCPAGHQVSKELETAKPGKVITIGVHAGYYADPNWPGGMSGWSTWPNFTTQFGTALNNMDPITSYPGAMVNRHKFEGDPGTAPYYILKAGKMGLSRAGWEAASDLINSQPAPVNLGMKSSWDEASRTLTVTAETYYTADQGDGGVNNLNVALCENGVIGKQANALTGVNEPNYVHDNMLRHLLTGQWGEPVEKTTVGSRNRKTYTYVVPENIKIENCEVVAFVTQDKVEILNALKIKAK